MRRRVFALIGLVLIVAAASPWLCGVLLQMKYQDVVSALNKTQSVNAAIVNYERGWLNSEVTLDVKIKKPELYEFTIQQHVTHGPLIFAPSEDFAALFGLGVIQNEIHFAKDTAAKLKMHEADFLANDLWVMFNDRYLDYFKMASMKFKITSPHDRAQTVYLRSAEGHLLLNLKQQSVSGNLALPYMKITDGKNSLEISELNTSGNVTDVAGQLSILRKIDIDQITFEGWRFGPIHLQVSADKINLATLQDMYATYLDIRHNGEMYPSQLKIKLLRALPNAITGDSNIKVEQLEVGTPQGDFQFSGTAIWPAENFTQPDDFSDLLQTAQISAQFSIAKPLVNEFVDSAATMPDFIQQESMQDQAKLLELQDQVEFSVRQNVFLITDFENKDIISSVAADQLLKMQDDFIPLADYSDAVSKLFWSKDITLAASYWLTWQYAQVQKPYEYLLQKMAGYQYKVKEDLHGQIRELISQHFLRDENGNYSAFITWMNGELKVNNVVY